MDTTTGPMGGFYTLANWIMRLAYVNILWIAFSLVGIIILGFFPATIGMFTVIRKWIQGDGDIPIFKIGRDTSELQSRGHLVCRLLLEKKRQLLEVTNVAELNNSDNRIYDIRI